MINPLNVASDGYLKCAAKTTLAIAVAGYLCATVIVPPNKPHCPPEEESTISSGFGVKSDYKLTLRERAARDEEDTEIISFIQAFLQTQE